MSPLPRGTASAAIDFTSSGASALRDLHDASVHQWMARYPSVGLSCVVVRDGEISYLASAGQQRLGGPPVNPDTVFPVASISKSFTSAVAALLVGDGLLDWDDPVQRWLPWIRFHPSLPAAEITLRDLLGHRLGLQRVGLLEYGADFSQRELLERLEHVPPACAFRTVKSYTNIGYLAAGWVLEAASGKPWSELVRSRLLEPLEMVTATPDFISDGRNNVTDVHVMLDGKMTVIPRRDRTSHAPASTVHASAKDMARWLSVHAGGGSIDGRSFFEPSAWTTLHTPQIVVDLTEPIRRAKHFPAAIVTGGLGWSVEDRDGYKLSWHDGGVSGLSSMMVVVPELRLGVFAVQNTPVQARTWGLANEILDREMGRVDRDWTAPAAEIYRLDDTVPVYEVADEGPPKVDFAQLAGDYEHPVFGGLQARLDGERLRVSFERAAAYNYDLTQASGNQCWLDYHDLSFSYGERPIVTVEPELGSDGRALVFDAYGVGAFRRRVQSPQ